MSIDNVDQTHQNLPTMNVIVHGELENRVIVGYENPTPFSLIGENEPVIPRPIPRTQPGEVVYWTINGKCYIGESFINPED